MGSTRVIITVTGHAEREYPPNRCTVHLRVACDARTRKSAANRSTTALDALTALIDALEQGPDNPLRRWSLDQVRHSRSRPYSNDGTVQPWLYQSSAGLAVTFRDLSAVGQFTDEAARIDGVQVEHLDWALTRAARAKALAKVRRLALRDATAKAGAYARRLGLKDISVIALADPGMLGVGVNPAAPMDGARVMLASHTAPAGDGPNLRPERLRVAADVDARFEAS